MADSVNMSLDEIIKQSKQNRTSRPRGRGGAPVRGRGGGRGGGRGVAVGGRGVNRGGGGVNRGSGGRGRGRGTGRPNSRSGTPGPRQGRSRSRGPQTRGRSQSRARSQSRPRSQSRTRSRSRQRFRSNSRSMSRPRSQQRRALTPRGRAGLEVEQTRPTLLRNRFGRGGQQNRLLRSNSNPNLRGGIHSRLGLNTRRGKPLAVAKRGISKRGRGLITSNYSAVGLRSDQILQEQRRNLINQNHIRSQTFTRSRSRSRSRNNSFNATNALTVSVANDFAKRRRNSIGNAGFLTKQNLAQLNNQFGGYNTRRGPGSVKSMASNRSNHSNRSYNSNRSRGRGRGGNRGVSRKFVNKQILNSKLQLEIASIQGKSKGGTSVSSETAVGINFSPTPVATRQSLHERFAST